MLVLSLVLFLALLSLVVNRFTSMSIRVLLSFLPTIMSRTPISLFCYVVSLIVVRPLGNRRILRQCLLAAFYVVSIVPAVTVMATYKRYMVATAASPTTTLAPSCRKDNIPFLYTGKHITPHTHT